MSFFDVTLPPSELQERTFVQPEWVGSPRGVLPGYSPQRATVFHTDRAILVVHRFLVYPTGSELTLSLWLCDATERIPEMPWELRRRWSSPDPLPDDFLRFGVLFGDGSKWTNLDWRPDVDETPPGPILVGRGGSGGDDTWEMSHWMWPLPPDGPLTFVAQWPAFGVEESRAEVDGTAIHRAADDAQVIFHGRPGGGGFTWSDW